MGLKESGQIGGIKVHPFNTNTVWLAALGSPFGPNDERGIFKTTDGGKTWKKTLFVNNETGGRDIEVDWENPDILYAAMYKGFRKGWDIISGGPASEGGIYKSTDGGETWKHITNGLPKDLIGKIDIDIARSNPRVLYAMVEALGNQGGLYRSSDAGEIVDARQQQPGASRAAVLLPLRQRQSEERKRSVGERAEPAEVHRWRQDLPDSVETPHGDNHGMWFNPDNPNIILQVNDGGANVSLNGGKSWSSILNQPTAEYYMVAVDEQYPYRLYMPQQDNSTLIIPSVPPVSWGFEHPAQAWQQASGCETGQIWPKPDGKVVWGACKGEVGRYNTVTGQEKHYWVYPQNRYGHDPDDIKFRFPRQTVVYVSPHDSRVIYQASHVLHRSIDEGISWDIISPDLTAKEPQYQIVSGNPITRDVTGEEVYSTIYSMIESRLERGVIWVGVERRPGQRDARQRQDVEERHAEGPGRRAHPDRRRLAAHEGPRLHRRLSLHARARSQAVHLSHGQLRRDVDAADRRQERHPDRLTRRASSAKIRAGRPALRRHRVRLLRVVQRRQELAAAAAEPAGDAGHRHQGASQRSRHLDDGTVGVDHGQHHAAAGAGEDRERPRRPRPVDSFGFSATDEEQQKLPAIALFQPREAIRFRNSGAPASVNEPEYPSMGAQFDLYFASAPGADTKLEVLDAKGGALKTWSVLRAAQRRRRAEGGGGGGGFRRGGGGSAGIRAEAGMQRITWDLRYPGPWAPNTPEGGFGGPIVPPGKYSVRLTSGGQTITRTFDLKSDPRVAADGVTDGDIAEQVKFQLQVRDAISEARKLQQSIEQAMQKAGLKPMLDTGAVGSSPSTTKYDHPLRELYAKVVTTPGIYTQGMLIDQLSNIQRMITQADQKIGKDAYDRYADLIKEMAAIEAQLKKIGS